MADKKYTFSQVSDEEKAVFDKELGELLNKHSFVAESIPVCERIGETGQFAVKGILLLQKKTEVVEAEIVSPIQKDDIEKKN